MFEDFTFTVDYFSKFGDFVDYDVELLSEG